MTRLKQFFLSYGFLFSIFILCFHENAYSERLVETKQIAYSEWKKLGYELLNEATIIENISNTIIYDVLINTSHILNMSRIISETLRADLFNQDERLKDFQKEITFSGIETFSTQIMGLDILEKARIENLLLADAIYWEGELSSNIYEISSNLFRDEINFNSSFSHFLAQISLGQRKTACLANSASLVADGLKNLIEIAPRNSRKDRLKIKEIIESVRSHRQAIYSKVTENECKPMFLIDFCKTHSFKGSKEFYRTAAQAFRTSFNESYGVLMTPLPPPPPRPADAPEPRPEAIHIVTPRSEAVEREKLRTAAIIELSALRDLVIESVGAKSECSTQNDILR